jgi:hypothetical protein
MTVVLNRLNVIIDRLNSYFPLGEYFPMGGKRNFISLNYNCRKISSMAVNVF